jgi:hypothetical protein
MEEQTARILMIVDGLKACISVPDTAGAFWDIASHELQMWSVWKSKP